MGFFLKTTECAPVGFAVRIIREIKFGGHQTSCAALTVKETSKTALYRLLGIDTMMIVGTSKSRLSAQIWATASILQLLENIADLDY